MTKEGIMPSTENATLNNSSLPSVDELLDQVDSSTPGSLERSALIERLRHYPYTHGEMLTPPARRGPNTWKKVEEAADQGRLTDEEFVQISGLIEY